MIPTKEIIAHMYQSLGFIVTDHLSVPTVSNNNVNPEIWTIDLDPVTSSSPKMHLATDIADKSGFLREWAANLVTAADEIEAVNGDTPLEQLGLSVRAENLMRREGVKTLAHLRQVVREHSKGTPEVGLLDIRNMTPSNADEIIKAAQS